MRRVMRRTVTDRNPCMVRGEGMGIYLFDPKLKVAERVFDACMERGLIVYPGHGTVAGAAGDHLMIGPPLVITATQIDDLLATLAEAAATVEKEIRP